MKHIRWIAFALITFLFIPMSVDAASYPTPVKVKLLPTATFLATANGNYQLIDLKTKQVIPFTNPIAFSQTNGAVVATINGVSYTSTNGFLLDEVTQNDQNDVTIGSIQQANGTSVPVKYRGSFEITPGSTTPNLFNTLDIENYLKGVVPGEMPASWHKEALKAQAVAARSYAYAQLKKSSFLQMTVASQVYGGKSKEQATSTAAVNETAGVYATYQNEPIPAYFHSSSGGNTENSENVWSSTVPYIRSVSDPYDRHKSNPHYGWNAKVATNVVSMKFKLTNEQVVSLRVTQKTNAGSVQQMEATVYNPTTGQKRILQARPSFVSSADAFRSFFGVSLKSIAFDVKGNANVKIKRADGSEQTVDHIAGYALQTTSGQTTIATGNASIRTENETMYYPTAPTEFTFTGNGWGHRLGMSQWGARSMAEKGFTYDQILKYYYKGIEVKKIK
ncbi:SpoIID/LytB domain-containing protein [Anoxybacillus salavatliensis]|uniref:SpoIID/LytB domain-containing protein n=1 Tax=Anoxybacillus gonensis TaxID=198467 RepID=UPI00214C005F|nr:SpoIID/LytB domain-containing protein [Anoxybacillus gonensis]MCQ5363637.1 SpoIID/LytB domain-containing protein [Anoxybacillus gonensis]